MLQKVVSRFAKLYFKVQQICHYGMNTEELSIYLETVLKEHVGQNFFALELH